MTAVLLSSRQRAILEAMAAGAPLRWLWVDRPSLGAWRYVLAGKPVDGRSVAGLLWRGYLTQRALPPDRGWLAVELTDEGGRAVRPEVDGL